MSCENPELHKTQEIIIKVNYFLTTPLGVPLNLDLFLQIEQGLELVKLHVVFHSN